MNKSQQDQKIAEQIGKLEQKYEAMGQDLSGYLDGLLYSDYLTYWDYIHLDTLLSLQTPRTNFPDEKIFILYHQSTELYFRMILNELEQAVFTDPVDETIFKKRLKRINRYWEHLVDSFDVMIDGMDKEQFLKYRMSLMPASGFQSAQYRIIETYCTDFINLVNKKKKAELSSESSIEEIYEHIYWKSGATEAATGKKTLTLKQFEQKYSERFIKTAHKVKNNNLWKKYELHYKGNTEIELSLKKIDLNTNVIWPLQHLKSASTYLVNKPETIEATGGTNWQKYLPPMMQCVTYFPELWTEEELKNWGNPNKLPKV